MPSPRLEERETREMESVGTREKSGNDKSGRDTDSIGR